MRGSLTRIAEGINILSMPFGGHRGHQGGHRVPRSHGGELEMGCPLTNQVWVSILAMEYAKYSRLLLLFSEL